MAPVVAVGPRGSAAADVVAAGLQAQVGTRGGPGRVVELQNGADDLSGEGPADLAGALTGVDVVVHVAVSTDLAADLRLAPVVRRARTVGAVERVATAARRAGVRRIVLVTSAMVLGARADNPVPLAEDAVPLGAPAGGGAVSGEDADPAVQDDGPVGDLVEAERVLAAACRPTSEGTAGPEVTVLRPAALAGHGVDTLITRHFAAPRLLSLRGHEMRWQFCHVEDLAAAVATVVEHDLGGVLGVGTTRWLTDDEVAAAAGMRRVVVPLRFAFDTAQRLQVGGVLPTPAGYLAYVVHPWVVLPDRLLAAGWGPARDAEECLRAVVAEAHRRHADPLRRVERRDSALGAAGAAVALVGAAALVRRARSGRRPRPRL